MFISYNQSSRSFISLSSMSFVFNTNHRINGSNAIRIGDITPILELVTFIIVHTHAVWISVNTVILYRFTVEYFAPSTPILSLNRPRKRSHNSNPCNEVYPRYKNIPDKAGFGTVRNRFRGLVQIAHIPIMACIANPVTRFSIVPSITSPLPLPLSLLLTMLKLRTCAALLVGAPHIHGNPSIDDIAVSNAKTSISPCIPSRTDDRFPFLCLYRG